MTLESEIAKLKYHNPQFLEDKRVQDLDDLLGVFQDEFQSLKALTEMNSKQIVLLRASIGEFKLLLKTLERIACKISKQKIDLNDHK